MLFYVVPSQPPAQQANAKLTVTLGCCYALWPIFFRITGNLRLTSAAFVVYGVLVFGYLSFAEGGLLSFKSFLSLPFAALAIFFLGWKLGLIMSTIILAGVIAMYLIVGIDPDYLPEDPIPYLLNIKLAGVVATLVLVTAMFVIFEREIQVRTQALVRAKHEAERASAAKSEFLATMSHEIRTPMQGVLGMADVLAEGKLDAESKRLAHTIQESGTALLTILNDILDFSKVEAGELALETAPFDLRRSVEDVAVLLGQKARDKGIHLVVDIAPDVPVRVVGDVGRVRQVLTNLVGNAVKFTTRGHVAIKVEQVVHAGVSQVRFLVQDTGIGIEEGKHSLIFDSFSQAEAFTTRQYGGTGLGLAISKRLVKAMGGDITVTSELGVGSEFSFSAPLPEVDDMPPAVPQLLRGRRVKLDIDLDVLKASCAALCDRWGLIQDTSETDHVPDLILTDRTLVSVSNDVQGRPAVIVIGHMPPDVQARASAKFIPTPFRSDELFENVAELLDIELPQEHAAHPSSRLSGSAPGSLMRILAADDNAVNQAVLSKMLTGLDIELTIVDDGLAAFNHVVERRFDLVFMDVSMPVMDGIAATRAIRGHEQDNAMDPVPIIGLTAHVQVNDLERCVEAGMNECLTKPFRKSELMAVLTRWAQQQAA
ncbi:ATP-binding protein [Primorskyibacter sp. S187A]|uniref:ATP-binding protein n=1 Tax=Primorskyibacter sp. S187A TaxID=3415130 RepID=UPI003C799C5D